MRLARHARSVRHRWLVRQRAGTSPSGIPLPPVPFRMGGEHFKSDDAFVASAVSDARRLIDRTGLNRRSSLLDWGCGAGRLAVGIAELFDQIKLYLGVDVQRNLIDWASRHIGAREGYEFVHVDLSNARYNPKGQTQRVIPGADGAFDVLYAYSVLSHMTSDDVAAYLTEIRRLLTSGGTAFVTAFVEQDVPAEMINPTGYGPLPWSGPLHCVRYEKGFFEGMVRAAGLMVKEVDHGGETDGQTLYLLFPDA